MPLSEHEQRLLEQMEKALYAEDPKFATSLRSTPGARAARGRASLGVLGILGGLALLVGGVATNLAALGVVGFLAMLVGSVVVYTAFTTKVVIADGETAESTSAPQASKPSSPGFMDKMEDRWRRRSDGDPQP